LIGAWRAKPGAAPLRISRFALGFVFALGMAGVRFLYAR
jgi:hypothetical protein